MSTYKGRDNCTDIILDFIAGGVSGNPSGESDGNYDAVIGSPHSKIDLNTKTLDEIYALQGQLLAKGLPSSAVGRYQFVRGTLKVLQTKMALPGSTIFSEVLEDRLAWALLVGRGYPAWWRGALTDTEFAHGLSMEWASLPDPNNGGRSHYQGVGPNHASTTVHDVFAMLAHARSVR